MKKRYARINLNMKKAVFLGMMYFLLCCTDLCSGRSSYGSSKTETVYAAFFVKPSQEKLFMILPALRTIKSILLSESNSVLIYTFPDDIADTVRQNGLVDKILSSGDLENIRHQNDLNFDISLLHKEMMLIRIDLYRQFLERKCCKFNVVFTDLDQLFIDPISTYLSSHTKNWDMAHVHKGHGNNAGLFIVRSHGMNYGREIFSSVFDIYNKTIRFKICKGGISCLKVGGEQLAIDRLIGHRDVNWLVNKSEWFLKFRDGIILNLDSRIFNAVPGRFEINPETKVMHFMGYRKKCMRNYMHLLVKSGIRAILRLEGYKTEISVMERIRFCKKSKICKPCVARSKIECDKALLRELKQLV